MGAVVSFSYPQWAARYPELAASVDSTLAQAFFSEATLYQRNDGGGPIADPGTQLTLLNMLTAHIAALNTPIGGKPVPGLVGRISGATQGSVSAQADYGPVNNDIEAWAIQTRYGAAWWTATAQFRTFQYRPGPRRVFDPVMGLLWPRRL